MADIDRSWSGEGLLAGKAAGATLLLLGYAILATLFAGAASPVAGLAVLVTGLMAALLLDLNQWRSGEAELFRPRPAAEEAAALPAPPAALPAPDPAVELAPPAPAFEPIELPVAETPPARRSRRAEATFAGAVRRESTPRAAPEPTSAAAAEPKRSRKVKVTEVPVAEERAPEAGPATPEGGSGSTSEPSPRAGT